MLPLRDDNPTTRFAYVTLGIIVLNVLAFLFWEPTFAPSTPQGQLTQETFFFCHAEIPWELSHQTNLANGGAPARQAIESQLQINGEEFQRYLAEKCGGKSWILAVFTAMFLHAGWLHIGGNMLFLWVFGNNVEDKLGPIKYVLFYFAGGIAATLAQTVVAPGSVIPNLGASGAIAGVLGAYILMFPRRRVLTLVIFFIITAVYVPAWVLLGVWFALQVFSGVGSLSNRLNAGGGVAFFAHIGGFVFGALMALLFFPRERFGARPPPVRPDLWGRRGGPGLFRRRQPPPPPPPDAFPGWGGGPPGA